MNFTHADFLRDLAYTRLVATELRLRFLMARPRRWPAATELRLRFLMARTLYRLERIRTAK